MASSAATPSPRRGDDKRERILRAARGVAEREGVAAARMEEVAALAQVSKGTLYRFFESKEDLFLAMMIGAYEEGLRLVDTGMDPLGDPAGRLASYLEGLVKVLASMADRMNIHYQAWGLVARDPDLKQRLFGFLREFHRRRSEELEQIIRDGQEAGIHPREIDLRAVCDAVGALLSGFLYRATFDPLGASPEALRRCFDALVRSELLSQGRGGRAPGEGA